MKEELRGKRVTVAGATGFIGTNLVDRLVQEGAIVRALTHTKPVRVMKSQVDYMNVDLSNRKDCIKATTDTDIFIMAAANSSGAGVMAKTPLVHLTPNVVMNALSLEACLKNEVKKYCFISSNTVYPASEKYVTETDVTGKFFETYRVVGSMKLFSEQMVEMFSLNSNGAMAGLVIRPGNLYGPFDKFAPNESKVVAALIRRAVNRENPFIVWGDGKDIKDFLYINDFIEALVRSLKLDQSFLTLNIASGVSVELKTVIDQIVRATNIHDLPIRFDESKPTMIPKRLIDISLAKKLLSWSPKVSLVEGIEETVKWFKDNNIINEVYL